MYLELHFGGPLGIRHTYPSGLPYGTQRASSLCPQRNLIKIIFFILSDNFFEAATLCSATLKMSGQIDPTIQHSPTPIIMHTTDAVPARRISLHRTKLRGHTRKKITMK